MDILIKNTTIVTMSNENEIIQDGFVVISGDRIAYVGEAEPEGFSYDRIIDGRNKAVLPGLMNMHTHSPMVLVRGYADDMCLQDWLFNKIFPVEAQLAPEDVYWGSTYAIMEMLRSGITSFADMYFYVNEVARAVNLSGMRACLCTGIQNGDKIGRPEKNSYLAENRRLYDEWNGRADGRISVYMGPHSVYMCEPELLYYISDLAHQLGTGIHIHVSETIKENLDCIKRYGKSPVALLDEIGLLGPKTIAAHCVHVSEEDMNILKDRGVSVAYNPTSNLKLGSGLAPIKRLLQKGINLALGTDGASSNNNLNIFEEMHLAALISKGAELDSTCVDAFEAVSMATTNGAKALGKIIMENREFNTIDSEQAIYNIKRIAARLGR
jgi:5-methylthioadenosine/S-adenosylhomocysteine deaminase